MAGSWSGSQGEQTNIEHAPNIRQTGVKLKEQREGGGEVGQVRVPPPDQCTIAGPNRELYPQLQKSPPNVFQTFRNHSRILVKYKKMPETYPIMDTKKIITSIFVIIFFYGLLTIC